MLVSSSSLPGTERYQQAFVVFIPTARTWFLCMTCAVYLVCIPILLISRGPDDIVYFFLINSFKNIKL